MDLAHARSLLPPAANVHIEPYRPDREATALKRLACWMLRYGPLVAVDPPDGLMIDATGLAHLYARGRWLQNSAANEMGMAHAISAAMRRLGFSVRVAAASSFAAAWGLARFVGDDIVCIPPEENARTIAALPVEALRIDGRIATELREVGLTHIAHVLQLPRAELAARFGDGLPRRLDALLGDAGEIIEPVRSDPPLREELVFDGPTDRWEAVEAAMRETLERVVARLAERGQGTRELELEVLRSYGRRERIPLQLSQASRARRHLWPLVRRRLERIDMDAGVEGVAITAGRPETLRQRQSGLGAFDEEIDGAANEAAWGELIDNLVSRLGVGNVARFEAVESHLPERTFRERSIMEPVARKPDAAVTRADRPTRLFARPQPVRVLALTPDGPILSVWWEGRERRAVACVGPERISAEWWRCGGRSFALPALMTPDRDYFAVQVETGRWLWVCRQVGVGRWFVHGDWA
jgi:protein ImuB